MNIRQSIVLSLITSFIIIGCKITKPIETVITPVAKIDCNGEMPNYESAIKPVFEAKCNNCHNRKRAAGGYDFTAMSDITKAARNGELLGTIKWEPHFPRMPQQRDKLNDTIIKKIECWIENGMQQ